MSDELQQWVRLIQNVVALALVIVATALCFGLWLENRRLYLLFGVVTFFALVPLLVLRVAAVPEPPLLPQNFIEVASLLVNAVWPLFGLAWLAAYLHDRLQVDRLRRKYLLNESGHEEEENDANG